MRAPSASPRSLPICEGELELPLAVSVDTLPCNPLYFPAPSCPWQCFLNCAVICSWL